MNTLWNALSVAWLAFVSSYRRRTDAGTSGAPKTEPLPQLPLPTLLIEKASPDSQSPVDASAPDLPNFFVVNTATASGVHTGAAVTHFNPVTGRRWGIAIRGMHAGCVIEPCECGCNYWNPVRAATAADVERSNKLTERKSAGKAGMN